MSEIRTNIINSEDGTAAVHFPKGQVITGPATATSFAGAGTNLTGLPAGELTGVLPALNAAALTALNASNISSGIVTAARLGGGTANATTFLNGHGQYAEAGGGKVYQAVMYTTEAIVDTTNASHHIITQSITPTKSSSNILIMCNWWVSGANHNPNGGYKLTRGGTALGPTTTGQYDSASGTFMSVDDISGTQYSMEHRGWTWLDTGPSGNGIGSTSAVEYKLSTSSFARLILNKPTSGNGYARSTMVLMEVGT